MEIELQMKTKENLKNVLKKIVENYTNYEIRSKLVFKAMCLAHRIGYIADIRIDKSEPDWPVFYICLPNGEVSWHMSVSCDKYIEYTPEECKKRCLEYNPDS